uniref:Uncharacterized protein n=1 Tax=Heterorhabditis bacteriophora TaxID=37862 RepID=A0A1I7W914_HETBA
MNETQVLIAIRYLYIQKCNYHYHHNPSVYDRVVAGHLDRVDAGDGSASRETFEMENGNVVNEDAHREIVANQVPKGGTDPSPASTRSKCPATTRS